jgi:glycosyltransferase involved in cell wall biosynthesis
LKVGFIGRLEEAKGLNLLLQFIEHIPNYVELTIVGSGDQRALNSLFKQQNISHVRYISNISNENLPSLIKSLDVVLNPATGEGISRVTLEAMSSGRPVIMIDKGDRDPIINNKNGFLIPYEINSLRDVLSNMWQSKDNLHLMGKNAREAIENKYSDEILLSKIAGIYNKVSKID